MPTIPTIDLSKFKLPTIDLSKVELPDLSKIELPKIDFSAFDLRAFEAPTAEQIIEWFRDAVFAAGGIVALTAERVAELQKQVVELVTAQVRRVPKTV